MLARAAAMRREPTQPEHLLWLSLRDRRLGGYKFRRQPVILGRIADFFCPAKGVIIEIDGETHDRERDLRRDAAMCQQTGFVTLRFTNDEVMRRREDVLGAILLALEERADRWGPLGEEQEEQEEEGTTPQPPPLKRRGSSARG